MDDLTPSRRNFLRNALGVVILASTAPAVVIGRVFPTLSKDNAGNLVATYVIALSDYPTLVDIGGSVKLTSPEQLMLNPDHKARSFTGKTFPIAITRVSETGTDAFKAVSTYCSHGADYQVRDYDPIKGWFVCPHQGSTFKADGTHVIRINTPPVGPLRKFPATYDEAAGTITLENVLAVADVDDAAEVPATIFLDQNYPNPFNPTTLSRYGIPERARVTITIHTLLGSKVDTIVDEMQEAGVYMYDFSARDIPSGVYFYRMQTAMGTLTRRMTVTK
jgi:Rieske Fe-S protein